MELGGNIVLDGFDDLDRDNLVVLKKMVGNYAKNIYAKKEEGKLTVTLKSKDNDFTIEASLKTNENEEKHEASDKNMFVALNNALSQF